MVIAAEAPAGSGPRQRAFITGAASGIGRAAALRLIEDGWHVTGLDRQERPAGMDAADWIVCDLAEPLAVSQACNQLTDTSDRPGPGHLDAIILSAGIAGVGDPTKVLQVNFFAARQIMQHLAPHVREGGSVTLVSSGAGWRWLEKKQQLLPVVREPDLSQALAMAGALCGSAAEAYNCSKELLCALVAHECLTHWSRSVRLNAVSPGSVDTPLIADFTASMGSDAMQFSRATVGRDGTSEEIAEVIAFLSSRKASWINGADIKVDGGLTGALAGDAAHFAGWAE